MLKKAITLAGEALGVITPALPDATAAADLRRQDLVIAQSAVATAEESLQAAHDRAADASEITSTEATLADARLTAERAQRAYVGAEKRLTKALEAEAAGKIEAARVKLAEALAIRTKAAGELDRLAALVAEQVKLIDGQRGAINEAQRDGAGPRYFAWTVSGQRAAELALSKAGAIERTYAGDPMQHPGAVDVIGRDNGALTAA